MAAGTNITGGGFLRVTTGGLIQVDLDGGGDAWATLSQINGNGAVAIRYMSGGVLTTTSVSRVADAQAVSSWAAAAFWQDQPTLAALTQPFHGESWLIA